MDRKKIPIRKIILEELIDDIKEHPNYADLHNQLGIILTAKKEYKRAECHFLKAIKINPKYQEAIVNLFFFYLMTNRWKDAENLLLKYTRNKSEDPYYLYGKYYLQLVNFRKDFRELGKEIKNKNIFKKKGALEEIQNIYNKLDKVLRIVIFRYLKAKFHNLIGLYLAMNNRPIRAIKEFNKALAMVPNNFIFHQNLGMVYFYEGAYRKAISSFKKAIQINPKYGMGYAFLSYLYGLMKKPSYSLKYMEKAVHINPDYADLHYNLALLYSDKKNYKKAITEFKEAIKINPNYLFARINLGVLFEEQNRLKEARKEYKEVLKINPEDEHVRKRLERISLKS